MMKIKQIILMLLALTFVSQLRADGMAFVGDETTYEPFPEEAQRAVILHESGIQTMRIAINLKLSQEQKGVWIFPVPAKSQDVRMHLEDQYPTFSGTDVMRNAQSNWGSMCVVSACTQIVPVVAMLPLTFLAGSFGGSDVITAGSADQWGFHAEVLEARSREALEIHLKGQGVRLDNGALNTFEEYCSEGWSLVVVWIHSAEEAGKKFKALQSEERYSWERQPCVELAFPTEKMFFPMRATRGYGDMNIPVALHLVGHMKLLEGRLYHKNKLRYFEGSVLEDVYNDIDDTIGKFIVPDWLKGRRFQYTLLHMRESKASLHQQDFRFDTNRSLILKAGVALSRATENPWSFWSLVAVMIAGTSYLSGGLAGLIVVKSWKGYASLGLWNIFTILGLDIRVHLLKDERGKRLSGLMDDRWYGKLSGRNKFATTFMLIYCLVTLVLWVGGILVLS